MLTITYGLRWEYSGAPSSPNGTLPYTVNQVDNFATMTVAPQGTALWHPQKHDFAPRLGIAWQARPNLVFRAGAGIFYDLGYSNVADGAGAWPFSQSKTLANLSFPLSAANASPPPFSTTPPVSYLAIVDPNHLLPRTYEWNASIERSLGRADVVNVTYAGAGARKLMRQDLYRAPNPSFTGEFDVMRNGASASYNALQAQFRHRFAHGLQSPSLTRGRIPSTTSPPTPIMRTCRPARPPLRAKIAETTPLALITEQPGELSQLSWHGGTRARRIG